MERIHLNGCTKLTDKGLCTIALKCPELKVLELRGCAGISSRGVTDIVTRCHNLERLDLTGKGHLLFFSDRWRFKNTFWNTSCFNSLYDRPKKKGTYAYLASLLFLAGISCFLSKFPDLLIFYTFLLVFSFFLVYLQRNYNLYFFFYHYFRKYQDATYPRISAFVFLKFYLDKKS